MAETGLAFLVGLASALLPLINIEVYLVGAAAVMGDAALVAMALAAGSGQTLGKFAYYYAGRGSLDIPWLKRRARVRGRWSARVARWRQRAEDRPLWAAGLLGVSSLCSVPPLMVVCVLAGAIRMPVPTFAGVTLVTRTVRFLLLVCVPGAAAWLLAG